MTDQAKVEPAVAHKPRVGRSPAYPAFPIDKALSQVRLLFKNEGKYETPASTATAAWGYSIKSSGGRQALATLKYYGLIDVSGDGDGRKVKVSSVALDILQDTREDETEKKKLIRKVALTPAIHKALYESYPDGLASDGTVTHYLVKEQGYSMDAARDVLAGFKQTCAYAGLYDASNKVDKPSDSVDTPASKDDLPKVEAGCKVQWTSAGVDQFVTPATVLALSDDGDWVFVDQSDAAVPLKEVTVIEATEAMPKVAAPPPLPPAVLAAREALKGNAGSTLREGQTILSQGKLKAGTFEIRVTGEIGAKEIGKIITLLKAQKLILSDDEEDDEDD
jgi:hypothetical protein